MNNTKIALDEEPTSSGVSSDSQSKIGCQECDCTFACYNGKSACIRIASPMATRTVEYPAADLLRAIADGKQIERQLRGQWEKIGPREAFLVLGHGLFHELRIARPMVTHTVTYPEPLRVKPETGQNYWVPLPNRDEPISLGWNGEDTDHRIFAAGMAFATKADAAEAHKALFGARHDQY